MKRLLIVTSSVVTVLVVAPGVVDAGEASRQACHGESISALLE